MLQQLYMNSVSSILAVWDLKCLVHTQPYTMPLGTKKLTFINHLTSLLFCKPYKLRFILQQIMAVNICTVQGIAIASF